MLGGGEMGSRLWQDQSNYKTPAKLEKRQKGATMCARAGQLITHISHISLGRQISNAPKIVYYICERGTGRKIKVWGRIGRHCVPLIWFLRQWVIVEFLDTFRILYFVCIVCVCESPRFSAPKTDGPSESLCRRILVAPGWSKDDDDDDDDSQRLYNWCQRKLPRTDLIGIYLCV